MAKHPSSFKLADSEGDLSAITEPKVIYEGSVRQLCPLAPNNVRRTISALVFFFNLITFDPSLRSTRWQQQL